MMVTNVDLELIQDHYDLEILSMNGGFAFKSATGFFNGYIDKWMEIKENSTGGARMIAKLFLNSLYGKFATNPDITGRVPVLDEETDAVRLIMGDEDKRDPIYTAMGVFITSYARSKTVRAAQQNYSRFAYADTDSLHLIGDDEPSGLLVHDTHLGAWSHEYDFDDAIFIRAKQYAEHRTDRDRLEVHFAGMPSTISEKITIDEIIKGATFHGKLVPRRVPGGIVLQDTTFTIK